MIIFVGLPEVKGWDSFSVLADRLSKHAYLFPCSSSYIMEGVAQLLAKQRGNLGGFLV